MHWQSFGEFLAMGKHGLYVWGAVGVMALAMVAEPILVLRSRSKLVDRLKRQCRAERSEARGAADAAAITRSPSPSPSPSPSTSTFTSTSTRRSRD